MTPAERDKKRDEMADMREDGAIDNGHVIGEDVWCFPSQVKEGFIAGFDSAVKLMQGERDKPTAVAALAAFAEADAPRYWENILSEREALRAEVGRLRVFEWMYKELCK